MFVISPELLNRDASDISLMSYNILLPNSQVGWWVYKYYNPSVPLEERTWEARKKLLAEQIQPTIDLFTFQECVMETHTDDLDFLLETHELLCHKRARIAMVTAWKKDRFELVADYHLNRTLVVVLRESTGLNVCIVNCHLSAGRNPKERFQQVAKAVQQVEKLKNRMSLDLVVFSGDFNSSSEGTAVLRFLEDGIVEPRFRESFYSRVEITSKLKEHHLGRFLEVYRHVTDATTMWARNSGASMINFRKRTPRPEFVKTLNVLFEHYATHADYMTTEEMERWICEINLELRGSEYQMALESMVEERLMRADFIDIYLKEVEAGKHWAVHNDLLRVGIELREPKPLIGRYALDQIWLRSNKFECTGVVPPISSTAKKRIENGDFPPNRWHPSDHFPLMVRFSPKMW
jgi:mRNA deadenylase 3'-5' endonuclease subunit Ccr4